MKISKMVRQQLWDDARAWDDNNYLVQKICAECSRLHLNQPNFASVIRTAYRVKTEPRFRRRYGNLRTEFLNRIQ